MNKFEHFSEDLRMFFTGDVPLHAIFDDTILLACDEAGVEFREEDLPHLRALAFWRYFNQTLIRSKKYRSHDSAEVVWPNEDDFISLQAQLVRALAPPSPPPPPPPPPVLPPVELGNWSSQFLADVPDAPFFGPAIFARPAAERLRYYAWLRDQGYRTVCANFQQGDWGPSKGHPEWTAGGWDWRFRKEETRERIMEARLAGLQVMGSLTDQPLCKELRDRPDELIRLTQEGVDLYGDLVTLFITTWEGDEVWTNGDQREPMYLRWAKDVNWRGRDMGIHFTSGRRGEIQWYERLQAAMSTGRIVQLYQYPARASDQELRDLTWGGGSVNEGIAMVAKLTGICFCNFEHSSMRNQSPNYTMEGTIRRRRIIMEEAAKAGLPPSRIGYMN